MRPRLRFDSQILLEQEYGGISRYFTTLAAALAARGDWAVEVGRWLAINRYSLDAPGIRRIGLPCPPWPRGDRFRLKAGRLLDTAMIRCSRPDLLHCTNYRLPPRTGARTVVTVFDCIAELFPARGADPAIARKRLLAERADAVICISGTTARDLSRLHGIPAGKLHVIHLASSLPNPSGAGRPQARPYLLFVGHRASYKNWRLLRQAYETDPRLHRAYDLICFGGPPLTADEQPSCGRAARLVGNDQHLADLYRHAAALIYPSLYEGFGLPPLEAWQCSCPVFHCGGGSVEEVVGEAGIRLDGHDAGAFAEGLARALADPDALAGAVERGRVRLSLYSWERCAAAHAAVYASLL